MQIFDYTVQKRILNPGNKPDTTINLDNIPAVFEVIFILPQGPRADNKVSIGLFLEQLDLKWKDVLEREMNQIEELYKQ